MHVLDSFKGNAGIGTNLKIIISFFIIEESQFIKQ